MEMDEAKIWKSGWWWGKKHSTKEPNYSNNQLMQTCWDN